MTSWYMPALFTRYQSFRTEKIMSEISEFSPEKVSGWYAKSKAKATALVLDAAKKGS